MCSFFLVLTCFTIRDYNVLPERNYIGVSRFVLPKSGLPTSRAANGNKA